MNTKELGEKGEEKVAKYLIKNKYKILNRNYSNYTGEIDIIAENKRYIIFVEVKTRSEGQMLTPALSVDRKKRLKIIKTAALYLQKYDSRKQPRFDIAEVICNQKGKLSVNYIENAFQQEGEYAVF
jgi:putative endonuclease